MTVINPTSSLAPSGWYRDPLGLPQLRWWNGVTWTNHIQEERPELQAWSANFATSSSPSIA